MKLRLVCWCQCLRGHEIGEHTGHRAAISSPVLCPGPTAAGREAAAPLAWCKVPGDSQGSAGKSAKRVSLCAEMESMHCLT